MSAPVSRGPVNQISDATVMAWTATRLLKRRRTKIVATLGPASSSQEVIENLMTAGVDVFRLNMSHGTRLDHRLSYERVRSAADKLGHPVAVLADLCGPKLRVGRFVEGVINLVDGDEVVVTTRLVTGQPGLIPSDYGALADDLRAGARILLDDGIIELRVEGIQGTEVICRVIHGGPLKDRKGMNLPEVTVSAPSFTQQDRADTQFVLDLGVDFIALSFVRRASDLEVLRSLVGNAGPGIIAKIETPEAVEAIDEILDASDGIMVARGDLGVEVPPEVVPIAQNRLLARARAKNKPAIVATQMLESMIQHSRPTRAEVSDVATAVFSGADAIMLSAETAAGGYPVPAVTMMDSVARQVEAYLWAEGAFAAVSQKDTTVSPLPLHVAIARSIAQLSRDLRVRSIVVLSQTGATARAVAAARPAGPVIVASSDAGMCRIANLLWGTVPIRIDESDLEDERSFARRIVRELGLANAGQYILCITGFAEAAPAITALLV